MIGLSFSAWSGIYGSGAPPIPPEPLDAPITAAMVTATTPVLAFGFDRLVEGYAGNAVNLKRLSDNATLDFGFDGTTGIFNLSGVNTWRAGADVDVVKFYDQCGGVKTLDAVGVVMFIRSNAPKQFGTTIGSDGQLTRGSFGGVAADLGDDIGAFQLNSSGVVASAGVEFHMLCSSNERKAASNATAGDPFGANSVQEFIFSYGLNTNVRIFHQLSGGTFLHTTRLQTTSTDQDTTTQAASTNGITLKVKQNSQSVYTYKIAASQFSMYTYGRLNIADALLANNVTNLAAAAMDNGSIVVGNTFATTSGTSLRTSLRADMVFGGLIVTKALTDLQRFTVQAKLNAIGQQHRAKSAATITGYFDEIVFLKNINGGTGLAAGANSKLSLQFPTGTIADGTPNFNFAFTQPNIGLQGVYAPDENNVANGFKATTNYFAGTMTGTVLSLHYQDPTGVSDPNYNSNLARTFTQGTGTSFGGNPNADWSLSLGYDHNCPTFATLIASAREDIDLIGTRHKADESSFGAAIYDGANQSMGKYNRNTSHNTFTFGETISGVVWNAAEWLGGGSAPYALDAPVAPPCLDNQIYPWKQDSLTLQVATFQAPGGYNRADPYSTRKALRLNAVNKSYVCALPAPLGQLEGSLSVNNNAAVCDSDDNAFIMTDKLNQVFKGTRFVFGFAKRVFSQTEIEEVFVNFYKLL